MTPLVHRPSSRINLAHHVSLELLDAVYKLAAVPLEVAPLAMIHSSSPAASSGLDLGLLGHPIQEVPSSAVAPSQEVGLGPLKHPVQEDPSLAVAPSQEE